MEAGRWTAAKWGAVLVPNDHTYIKFVSDLGGFDPLTHNGTIEMVVRSSFLACNSPKRIALVQRPRKCLIYCPSTRTRSFASSRSGEKGACLGGSSYAARP